MRIRSNHWINRQRDMVNGVQSCELDLTVPRWVEQGVREVIPKCIIDGPDFEWLMIDSSHAKIHPHAAETAEETRLWNVQKEVQH